MTSKSPVGKRWLHDRVNDARRPSLQRRVQLIGRCHVREYRQTVARRLVHDCPDHVDWHQGMVIAERRGTGFNGDFDGVHSAVRALADGRSCCFVCSHERNAEAERVEISRLARWCRGQDGVSFLLDATREDRVDRMRSRKREMAAGAIDVGSVNRAAARRALSARTESVLASEAPRLRIVVTP